MNKSLLFGLLLVTHINDAYAEADLRTLCQVEVGINVHSSKPLKQIESTAIYQQIFKELTEVPGSYQAVNLVCLTTEGALYQLKVSAPYYRNDSECLIKYNECTAEFHLNNPADQTISDNTETTCRSTQWRDPYCHGD